MAEPWIRVHAGLIDKPIVDRAVVVLDISEHEAIGLLVTFWGGVSQNIIGGHVADVSDRQIERWARWHGRRGMFAKFIREHHLDADGRVNEWDEYAGALESRREKERERLRNKRHVVAQQPANNGGDVAQQNANGTRDVAQQPASVRKVLQPARAVRNETKRDTTTASSSSARESLGELSEAASAALKQLVARCISPPEPMLIALGSMATGNDPATPQPTRAVLEQALCDYAANGDRWNAALFRRYLERAARGVEPNGAPKANGVRTARDFGGARNDATIDAWLADKERQRAELGEPEPEEITHGE